MKNWDAAVKAVDLIIINRGLTNELATWPLEGLSENIQYNMIQPVDAGNENQWMDWRFQTSETLRVKRSKQEA